jgi:hypothetical protein
MKKYQHLRAENEVVPLYVLRQQKKKNQLPHGNIYIVYTIGLHPCKASIQKQCEGCADTEWG